MVSLGDDLDDNMAQEALLLLNVIRAEWSLNVRNYAMFDQTVQILENRANITLGPGGDITVRPNDITQVVVMPTTPPTSINLPLGKPKPYAEYRWHSLTEIYSGYPEGCYQDTNFPVQTLWFFPGLTPGWWVRVQGMAYMTEYETLATQFMDPPEWFGPLQDALYLRLAVKYGMPVSQDAVIRLQSALKHLKNHMLASRLTRMPMGGLGSSDGAGFNFLAGQ
jgi:hypothetical protein